MSCGGNASEIPIWLSVIRSCYVEAKRHLVVPVAVGVILLTEYCLKLLLLLLLLVISRPHS